jgi:hypothetical protein
LLHDKVHGYGELIPVELSSLVDVGQIPNLRERVFWEIRVAKEWDGFLT